MVTVSTNMAGRGTETQLVPKGGRVSLRPYVMDHHGPLVCFLKDGPCLRPKDIILGGNHSQMAALNLRSRLADVLLPMEESAKAFA